MTRYQCKLSAKVLSKAVSELNEPEDNIERLSCIDALRDDYNHQHPDLKLLREDDAFILRFLRAKKFDHARALQTLKNYHYQRENWPDGFERVKNPVLVKNALDKGLVCPLEGKAKNGSTVVVLRPGLENCTNVFDIFACIYLTMDHLLDDEDVQIHGVVVINDLAYLNMEIVKQFSLSFVKNVANTMQECLPLRIKTINITNQPKIFDTVYALIYPLLKEKLKKRFLLHGQDFSKLYEVVDRAELPLMFAGSGPTMDVQRWKSELLSEGTAL